MHRKKGSLTVEAIISFTVFISVMFLLLTLVKLVLAMMILNNAAIETAKTIATGAYPISLVNELQEGLETKAEKATPQNLMESISGSFTPTGILNDLTGGNGKITGGRATEAVKEYIEGVGVGMVQELAYQLKGQAVNALAGKLIEGYVEDCGLPMDYERLTLRAIKLPQTDAEFKAVYSGALPLSESGTLQAAPSSEPDGTDGDFNAEDVLVCLEYDYQMALPFLPAFNLTLRSVSVEHAWIHGTGGGAAKRTEGIDISSFWNGKGYYVATGGYGKRYHLEGCSALNLANGKKAVTHQEAINSGFTPCKICNP